jgi:hypothetical protein
MRLEASPKHRTWILVPCRATPSHVGKGGFIEIQPKAMDVECTEAASAPRRHHLTLALEDQSNIHPARSKQSDVLHEASGTTVGSALTRVEHQDYDSR